MYKLPKGFDGAFFIGKTLELVSFSVNSVFFSFGENVSITVESSLLYREGAQDDLAEVQTVPIKESRLMQLVDHAVTRVHADEEGTLSLMFDNGHVLQLFDDSSNFESYSINDGSREIFV